MWSSIKAGLTLLWEKFLNSSACDPSVTQYWADGGWPQPSDEAPRLADPTDLPDDKHST